MPRIDISIPDEHHAIFEQAYELFQAGEPGIGVEEAKALQATLEGLYPDFQAAYHAIFTLTSFGHYVKAQGFPDSFDTILKVVKGQVPRFENVYPKLSEIVQKNAVAAAKVSGFDLRRSAPKVGESAPEGSLKATNFIPNPALRRPPGR